MSKKAPKAPVFPDTLYITRQEEDDAVWFNASVDLDGIDDDAQIVATYEFTGTGSLVIKRTLEA